MLTGFYISGGSTEGSLGGWLAQRQAALRELMAAGALSTFTLGLPCVPMISRAPAVPEKRFLWNLSVIELKALHLERRRLLNRRADIRDAIKGRKMVAQNRKNPVIADWAHVSGGSTEGSLGGWLAQRQAALREVMAAGALSTFTLGLPCVPILSRAPRVP